VLAEHRAAVAAIREAYAALPPGSPVRLAKRTSNLFRFRDPRPRPEGWGGGRSRPGRVGVHQGAARGPAATPGRVGGMTTYEDLADATLRHG
jgi:hypothetical protein